MLRLALNVRIKTEVWLWPYESCGRSSLLPPMQIQKNSKRLNVNTLNALAWTTNNSWILLLFPYGWKKLKFSRHFVHTLITLQLILVISMNIFNQFPLRGLKAYTHLLFIFIEMFTFIQKQTYYAVIVVESLLIKCIES